MAVELLLSSRVYFARFSLFILFGGDIVRVHTASIVMHEMMNSRRWNPELLSVIQKPLGLIIRMASLLWRPASLYVNVNNANSQRAEQSTDNFFSSLFHLEVKFDKHSRRQ